MFKQRQVFVYNKSKETFLAFRVRVADSIVGRLVGLLGKKSLQPDSGVWIVPSNAIHTIGMMFSFDLVLIDKNFKVVGLQEMVRPFRITLPNRKAESVLELPAHSIFRSRTQIGDQLVIERYEAKKPSTLDSLDMATRQQGHPVEIGSHEHRRQTVPLPPQSSRADSKRSRFADTKTQ
jgi:uncharacterized membrane protein (UPF0127 family)